ncbi:sel1 repeat family protein [Pseudoalteromonas sp. JBTF-M23]|uniref:Sel1 repeat family protein n=1 Tax=Pseudoalteromonas caenipelagi TaxID=2726988 RepID=A0A849V807_9GAMM|nr:sel1 repeat family protein [Pseudoalteromonas caenipelagi]
MRVLILIACAFILINLSACGSTGIVRVSETKLYKAEMNGLKLYRSGNYEQAFELLKEPAQMGYKGAQYVLAFMFLKGQYVEQSTVLGMGWLGVAKEADVKDWNIQFDKFYAVAPEGLKTKIDAKVAQYIAQFGLKAQNVTCKKSLNTSTKRVDVKCDNYEGIGQLYEIEMTETQ